MMIWMIQVIQAGLAGDADSAPEMAVPETRDARVPGRRRTCRVAATGHPSLVLCSRVRRAEPHRVKPETNNQSTSNASTRSEAE